MDLRGVIGAPALARRRIRVWAVGLAAVLTYLTIQAVWPGVRLVPSVGSDLAPGTVMAVFLMALACEYVDSTLGMGYGTTLTPLLLLLGFAPLQVVPCVLLSEFVTGLSAAILHHRDGNVDLLRDREARSTASSLCLLSAAGAVIAVAFAIRIPKVVLTAVIGSMIVTVGIITLATAKRRLRYRRGHIIALGTIAAFNKGLSGGGYGPLVTSGQVVSGLAPKKAVAVTSLAESVTCIIGLTAYLVAGKRVDWALALPLTVGAMFSVPVATLTVKRIPERAFRLSVGLITCALGALSLAKLL